MHSYRPTYHASVLSGWANDPNGTIFYNGKAHLFFQHYPYKSEWGTMHWGHFVTDDFIKWETLPLVLEPDRDYEVICGCCSGSTIEKDGALWLMYTAAQPERQRQCMAISTDGGIHFEKNPDNPILTSGMLSLEVTETDCRDPRMFRKGDDYYFIAGARVLTKEELAAKEAAGVKETAGTGSRTGDNRTSGAEVVSAADGAGSESSSPVTSGSAGVEGGTKAHSPSAQWKAPATGTEMEVRAPSAGPASGAEEEEKAGYGNLILCRSKDLLHWEYVGHLLDRDTEGQIPLDEEHFRLNGVYECPDYIVLDGKEIILSSPQNLPQIGKAYQNVHSGIYMFGELDFESGRFRVDEIGEVDSGFDFYAAQTLRMPDGRVVLIAWKEMWDRNFPTRTEGWAGTDTLPREMSVVDGRLVQKPVREIGKYRRGKVTSACLQADDTSLSVEGVCGNTIEIRVTLEPGTAARSGLKLFCGSEHETLVYYDRAEGDIVFDRSRSGIPFTGQEEDVDRRVCHIGAMDSIDLHFFLDVSSIEVFIDGGHYVMTGNVYPEIGQDTGVRFFAEGGSSTFRGLVKYDIVV